MKNSESPAWEPISTAFLGARPWAVMGGGGLKGLAHIGAWQALEEAGLEMHGIVGTSIGGLVAACISGGLGWQELVRLALALERKDLIRINRRAVWVNGIREESVFRGDVLRKYIEDVLPVRSWDELKIPVLVNAVDLATGRTEWFGPGARTDISLAEAIYASCALPVFYPPAHVGGSYLVDGGCLEALPLSRALEHGATGILAVDVGAGAEGDAGAVLEKGMIAVHQRVFAIQSGARRREDIEEWDEGPLLLIRPHVEAYATFDFDNLKYFLEEGYRATRAALSGKAGMSGATSSDTG